MRLFLTGLMDNIYPCMIALDSPGIVE